MRWARQWIALAAPAVLLVALGVAGCGDGGRGATSTTAGGSAAAVNLAIEVNDGAAGHVSSAKLVCDGSREEATGFLASGSASRLCAAGRALSAFLATPPRTDRACAQVFGGPQTATIKGTVGERSIDRKFSRRDACETADWEKVSVLFVGAKGLPAAGPDTLPQ